MKSFKTRHQLFLPDDLAKRLAALARSSGRARSEILVEALEAWFTRRQAVSNDEAVLVRLSRLDQRLGQLTGNQDLLWQAMDRLVRHQLITAAALPSPDAAARAVGERHYQQFIDEIAQHLAEGEQNLPQSKERPS